MGNDQSCVDKAQELFNFLNNDENVWMNGVILKQGSFCFRVPICDYDNKIFISISVPPDAMGNRDLDGEANTFETAIFIDNNIIYESNFLGYEDVLRFYSFIDVKNEIERMITLFNDNKNDAQKEINKIRNTETSVIG